MRPPAWSSLPESALNFTSTKPSFSDASCFTHHGYRPSADCLSTFGWVGAEASFSTDHLGAPPPVQPPTQPCGKCPGATSSKFTVAAEAVAEIKVVMAMSVLSGFTTATG